MAEFWVGVRGDLAPEQIAALTAAGIAPYDLRRLASGWGEPPIEWETMRTFVRVSAHDDSAAKAEIERVLGLDAADLVAYSADVFK